MKLKKIFDNELKVKNALISVSNKENLVYIIKTLKNSISILLVRANPTAIKKLGYRCTELSKIQASRNVRWKSEDTSSSNGLVFSTIDRTKNIKMKCLIDFPSIDLIIVNFYHFKK